MFKRLQQVFRPDSTYRQFFLSLLTVSLAYGLYKGIVDNYLAEIVTMSEFDRGVAEFFRELPGLALVFILAVFSTMSAEAMYKMGGFIMAVGVSLLAGLPADRILVTAAIFVYSLGEHIQLGRRADCRPGMGGSALGMVKSMGQIGALAGYLVVMVAFVFVSGMTAFRSFFWIAAALLLCSAILALRLQGHSETDKSKSRFYFVQRN